MEPTREATGRRVRRENTAGRWDRVLWLDGEIRAGRYPNVAALQEKFGIARRTALDTVSYHRETLGAPLAYDRERRGYTYTDPTYGLPAVFLAEGELLALVVAEQAAPFGRVSGEW